MKKLILFPAKDPFENPFITVEGDSLHIKVVSGKGMSEENTHLENAFASDLVNRYNNHPQLLEALQKCEPYMSDLQTENFSDESVGIRYDQDLENALTSLRTAIAAATITEDPPNPADAQADEMHANQPTRYDP